MFIIILIAIFVSLSLAYNKLNRGSTPRSYVTCKDLNDYRNRLDRTRIYCKRRMDLGKETIQKRELGV